MLLPILLFVAASTALGAGLLSVGGLLGPKRQTAVKRMPYESGMDPIHDAHRKFDVRFHLVAIAFLLFDVELLFLYPWAVASRNKAGLDYTIGTEMVAMGEMLGREISFGRGLVFGEVMFFMALLTLGLVYAWKKGVFQWR